MFPDEIRDPPAYNFPWLISNGNASNGDRFQPIETLILLLFLFSNVDKSLAPPSVQRVWYNDESIDTSQKLPVPRIHCSFFLSFFFSSLSPGGLTHGGTSRETKLVSWLWVRFTRRLVSLARHSCIVDRTESSARNPDKSLFARRIGVL